MRSFTNVLVSEHDPFGRAGCAGSVNQHGQVVRLDGRLAFVERIRFSLPGLIAPCSHVVEVDDFTSRAGTSGTGHKYVFLEGRHSFLNFLKPLKLVNIFNETNFNFAMVQNVGALFWSTRGINSDRDCTATDYGHVSGNPFHSCLTEHTDSIPGFHTESQEAVCQQINVLLGLVPGCGYPAVVFLVVGRNPVLEALGTLIVELGYGRCGHWGSLPTLGCQAKAKRRRLLTQRMEL